MMRRLLALLMLLAVPVAWAAPYRSRPDLVVPWSAELDAHQPLPRPFVCHYPHLYYLATHHSNSDDSPTFRLIRQVFETGVFHSVIVEGIPARDGENPPEFIRYAEHNEGEEAGLAARLALRHHIPFTGGEPPEEAVVHAVMAHDYTREDLLGFYFLRIIPEFRRDGTLDHKSMPQAFRDFMPDMMEEAGLQGRFTYPQFLNWYRKRNGKIFREDADYNEETAPRADSSLFTRRLSSIVGLVRDRAVVDTITTELNRHGSVLVVYGGSHFSTQAPALQAMLGAPLETFGPRP